MQKFANSHTLNASAERVLELICSEDYMRYRYDQPELLNFDLTITRDDEQVFEAKVLRTIDISGKVPKLAKKLVGDQVAVEQTQDWVRTESPYLGTLTVSGEGLPGQVTSRMTLTPIDDNSSTISVDGSISVSVPLVGGQLEKLLAGKAAENFSTSMQAIDDYIAKNA